MRNVDDEYLVHRVAEREGRALPELYDRYSRPVYATGVRSSGDVQLAEELVQDVLTNVWRGASSFDARLASFATWLHRIVRNRAVDLGRKRRIGKLPASRTTAAMKRLRRTLQSPSTEAWRG
jgi:RNA polymerase sigma factor (sigma-70 family)